MATLPKPMAPSKLVSAARTPQERADLERQWADYRSRKEHWGKMTAAAGTAQKATQQRQQQQDKGAAELEAIRQRVKRQEEGKSGWDSLSSTE